MQSKALTSLKLYEISEQYDRIFSELFDEETGEINPEKQAALNALDEAGNRKIISTACVIKNMEAEAKAINDAKNAMALREKRFKAEMEWLEEYLTFNMHKLGLKEISCPYFKISLRESAAVDPDIDMDALPEKFKRVKTEIDPNKRDILAALKAGEEVPGAKLKTNLNLTIK